MIKKLKTITLLLITMTSIFIFGCSKEDSLVKTNSVNYELEKKLDSYDNKEDISYDCDLLIDASEIEIKMNNANEELISNYNNDNDKSKLIKNAELYKGMYEANIEHIKELEEKARLKNTLELLQLIEELYKIHYYQVVAISDLKIDEVNDWVEVYNNKLDNYENKKAETMELYRSILE